VPEEVGYVNALLTKKSLREIIGDIIKITNIPKTAKFLDEIKTLGFRMAFKGGLSFSVNDLIVPDQRNELLDSAKVEVEEVWDNYNMGLITNNERYNQVIDIWGRVDMKITETLIREMATDKQGFNSVFMMLDSGARGSKTQVKQLVGIRGLMAKPRKSGSTGSEVIENPILSNFKGGLNVLDYFISTHGARKGLADTALRTADSGYLTRRLVDISHNVIVREEDCGATQGIDIKAFADGKEIIEPLKMRIVGRTAIEDILNPKTKEVIVKSGEEIFEDAAEKIEECGIETVKIRSVMNCETVYGICGKCYGRNLATGEPVNIGEAVGITAAQSIGEPGTQLTMRTFHTGGVAGSDITHGLPRVEELFEARKPKGLAEICEHDGTVISIESRKDNKTEIRIRGEEDKVYIIPYAARIKVKEGDFVAAGDGITQGPLNPHDILRLNGVEGVYQYLLKEVQRVYKQQGVDINDKHIEVIVSQMISKYKVEESGDTLLLPGGLYSKQEYEDANAEAIAKDEEPAAGKKTLLGITKASLATNSFLSAASFQETTRVLTDAAIKGKSDKLLGLKENVIIGKLIPAGTGMRRYRDIELDYGVNTKMMANFKTKSEIEEDREELIDIAGMKEIAQVSEFDATSLSGTELQDEDL
jgi:DNA-directed RNA polymerase subunit beta'